MYSGIATGTYTVSRTAGVPANYSTVLGGDCDTLGNVIVLASTTKTCTLMNTFTGTTTGTTTPPSTPPSSEVTPQVQKQHVLDGLTALNDRMANDSNTGHRDIRNNRDERGLLRDAIIHMRASLNARLWIDPSHVSDTRGDAVFNHEQEAVDDLIHMIKNSDDSAMDATLQGFIDQLVAADRQLAVTAIADAVAAGGTPQNITRANKRLEGGDTALANGKVLRAMWRHQIAWGFAVLAH
jgi:hypothetical protein